MRSEMLVTLRSSLNGKHNNRKVGQAPRFLDGAFFYINCSFSHSTYCVKRHYPADHGESFILPQSIVTQEDEKNALGIQKKYQSVMG